MFRLRRKGTAMHNMQADERMLSWPGPVSQ
jgi:hypothetical protein